jgi:hypothetical protein
MWSRVDDGVPSHPKFLKAGPAASWLWVCGLCYCNTHLTDGFIPQEALVMVAAIPDIQTEADRLVAVRLWEVVPGGYQVHDFHDFNDTKSEALIRQDNAREQRRKAGIASGHARRRQSESKNDPVERTTNGPVQHKPNGAVDSPLNPIPSHPSNTKRESNGGNGAVTTNGADFEQFWVAYPRKKSKKDAQKAFNALHVSAELLTAMLDAIEKLKQSQDWLKERGNFIPYPATWLNAGGWEDEIRAAGADGRSNYEKHRASEGVSWWKCSGCKRSNAMTTAICMCGEKRPS